MSDLAPDTKPQSLRQRILRRKQALYNERSTWISHWREISELQQPRAGRFVVTDNNKGDKSRRNDIIDNTAVFAARTLAAGLMSGITSPARPWFRLSIADKALEEQGGIKIWLHQSAQILRRVFAASNTYRALHVMYEELGLFGTAASCVVDDYESIIHHHPMTIGEYMLACGERGEVNTLCRDYRMTVGQLVERFGLKACSMTVRNLYDRGSYDQWVDVIHLIEPRHPKQIDASRMDAKNRAYASVYMEASCNEDQVLRESGFRRFPVLAPRWVVTGNDVYGHSPGMECLGDVKQLQHQQRRKGQAIDYQVNPPLFVPSSLKAQGNKVRLPGGISYVDQMGQNKAIQTAFEVQLNLQHLREDIMDVRERIRTAYYADLFLMLANDTRSGTTATEIAERHEEKLLMLGPVLERLHNELLEPLIDLTFDAALAAGILPPAPPELEGMQIEVEFVSVLAQAQRAVATSGMDRLIGTVGQMAALKPEILDKLDLDQAVDDYADAYGVNPALVVPDDQVAALRQQRAQQAAMQQAAAAAPVAVDAAKTASEINPQGLRDVMNQFQGYGSPSAPFVGG